MVWTQEIYENDRHDETDQTEPTGHPHIKKMNLNTDIHTHFTKLKLKWITYVKYDTTIMLLEDNTGKKLDDLESGNDFSDINIKDIIHKRNNWCDRL